MDKNKAGIILFFILPVVLGLVVGKVAYIINQEIIIRVLVTISENILVILKFITPWLVLCLTATAIGEIRGSKIEKIKIMGSLFRIIFITLIPLTVFVLIISLLLVPILSFDIVSDSSPWIDALFKIPLTPLFSTFVGIVLGFLIGLFFDYEGKIFNIIIKVQEIIYLFFKNILRPIMPIWIFASFSLTSYSGSGASFFLTDFLLSILILMLQFSWLSCMYYIVSKKIARPFKEIYRKGMEIFAYVVSLTGQGSGIILPFIIQREKDLGMDEQKAKLVTATSFNMPGSVISNIVFLIGVISMTNFEISLLIVIKLIFVVMLLTIIAPAIPGGTASIIAGILPNYGFSDTMIALYQSMYYKQGTSNAATNDASDIYITPFV